ncbi:hypothetical protein EKO23_02565 [Nocardioides guangzhouensis]|uniref:Uncharacterized protein n=1 Tax=Nocardioides guangzhouensis TaxID=2497878 RepID=A0A4Q4ZLB7_9ACTN|nr:hypothetical protein [Nocardioides guangzhouensis]RYP88244.1 hypothetical protein EKO23_02565 [Nocardioides guangzhouensis]
MKVTPTDPRAIGQITDEPAYVVVLHRGSDAEGFRLTGTLSVHEVMAWAEARAAGRTVQVFVEVDTGDDRQALRLLGRAPASGRGR